MKKSVIKEPKTMKPAKVAPQLTAKRRGEVGEAAFLLKATSMGFSVAKPWGDTDRFDFLVQAGSQCWRVQVKCAYSSSHNGGYNFQARGNVEKVAYSPEEIDFLVGYVVPEDVWYVVPVEAVVGIKGGRFFPSSKRRMSRFEKYREAWCLMACPMDGDCKKEISVARLCEWGACPKVPHPSFAKCAR